MDVNERWSIHEESTGHAEFMLRLDRFEDKAVTVRAKNLPKPTKEQLPDVANEV